MQGLTPNQASNGGQLALPRLAFQDLLFLGSAVPHQNLPRVEKDGPGSVSPRCASLLLGNKQTKLQLDELEAGRRATAMSKLANEESIAYAAEA